MLENKSTPRTRGQVVQDIERFLDGKHTVKQAVIGLEQVACFASHAPSTRDIAEAIENAYAPYAVDEGTLSNDLLMNGEHVRFVMALKSIIARERNPQPQLYTQIVLVYKDGTREVNSRFTYLGDAGVLFSELCTRNGCGKSYKKPLSQVLIECQHGDGTWTAYDSYDVKPEQA